MSWRHGKEKMEGRDRSSRMEEAAQDDLSVVRNIFATEKPSAHKGEQGTGGTGPSAKDRPIEGVAAEEVDDTTCTVFSSAAAFAF